MNLYLIGYRGSGKSSVAPRVAELLLRRCVDTDQQIELLTGQSIADIFAEAGEIGFRQWETTVIQAHAAEDELVVSLGGGAVTVSENRDIIRSTGKTVLLSAPAEVLWQRISADPASKQSRPSLTDLDGFAEVAKVLAERNQIYSDCADYTVDTSDLTVEQVAQRIAEWFDPVDT